MRCKSHRTMLGLLVATSAMGAPLVGQRTESDDAFRWRGTISGSEPVYIRNVNGRILAEPASGTELEVVAIKRWRRGDPNDVDVVAVPHGGTVTICAVRIDRDGYCDEGGEFGHGHGRRSGHDDIRVDFTLRVPRGVRLDLRTVNGDVSVDGASAPVVARTTNGDVDVFTRQGSVDVRTTNGRIDAFSEAGLVEARTTNGDIEVRINNLPAGGDLSYRTTNGSIRLTLPADIHADVDARVTNGRIHSDFPVTVSGRLHRRRLEGVIGRGGRRIELHTTNGSITLRPVQ